jgi:hypothetical protein
MALNYLRSQPLGGFFEWLREEAQRVKSGDVAPAPAPVISKGAISLGPQWPEKPSPNRFKLFPGFRPPDTPECPRCGNPNLARRLGSESCVCGWAKRADAGMLMGSVKAPLSISEQGGKP